MTVFISRAQWGSVYGTGGGAMGRVSDTAHHHTPGQDGRGEWANVVAQLRAIERAHVQANGWSAIGYTWLVSGQYACEGRGWGLSGAHAPGGNYTSIGIAFILDGRVRAPTDEEWNTAADIIRQGVALGRISPQWTAWGHRDYVATECPAVFVYSDLNRRIHAAYDRPTTPPLAPTTGGATATTMDAAQFAYLQGKLDYIQGLVDATIRESRAREEHLIAQSAAIASAIAAVDAQVGPTPASTAAVAALQEAAQPSEALLAAAARTDELLRAPAPEPE